MKSFFKSFIFITSFVFMFGIMSTSFAQDSGLRSLALTTACKTTPTRELSLHEMRKLSSLALNHRQLSVVPEFICTLSQLTELRLNNNHLSSLPDAFSTLTCLTTLDISHNKFTTLPRAVIALTAPLTQHEYVKILVNAPDVARNSRVAGRVNLHFACKNTPKEKPLQKLSFAGNPLKSVPAYLKDHPDAPKSSGSSECCCLQ